MHGNPHSLKGLTGRSVGTGCVGGGGGRGGGTGSDPTACGNYQS